MKKRLLTLLLIATSLGINSQTIFGKWHSKNDKTGNPKKIGSYLVFLIPPIIHIYEG